MKSIRYLFAAAVILAPLLLSAQTETEPNDALALANPLTLGAPMSGDIGGAPCASGTSDDWFSVVLPDDGDITITNSLSATGDGTLRVYGYNSGGSNIFSDDFATGAGGAANGSSATRTCLQKGTYYFLVQRLNGQCYNYALTISLTVPVFGDDAEPNNSFPTALPLAHNTYGEGHLNFLYGGDNDDRFVLSTPVEGTATVTMIAENSAGGTVRVYIYNGGGGQINSFDANIGAGHDDDTTSFSFDCYGQGTYYLLVQSLGGCGTGYKLKYQSTGAVYTNDVEPNNSFLQAVTNGVMAHNTFTEGHINFNHYGDNDDRYYLQTPAEGTMTLTMIAERVPATAGTLRIYVFNGGGGNINSFDAAVGGSNDDDTTTFSFDCYGQGDYYLLVQSLGACGISYKLKYQTTGAVYGNDVEPNNDFTTALNNGVLAPNTFAEGHINFAHYGDNDDRFAIQTADDGEVTFTMIAERVPATAGTVRVYVYNSGGGNINSFDASVGGSNDDDTTSMSFACYGGNTYYVLVQSLGACGISYKLGYTLAAAIHANDMGVNNTLSTAAVLNPDSASATGHVNFSHIGDDNDDRYRVTLPATGNIAFDFLAENSAGGTLRMYLYNSGGGQISSQDASVGAGHVSTTTTIAFNGLAAGTYYLLIQSIGGCGISYRFNCNDGDGDGTCNYFDLCPGGPEPGTACNDNNACTTNDVIQANCQCAGTSITCNDNDPCTSDSCNPLTGCVFTPSPDTDDDGTCDATDGCPTDANKTSPGTCGCGNPEPGTTCNDGNVLTINDVIGANCLCAGIPVSCTVNGDCNDNNPCTSDACDNNVCVFTPLPDGDGDGTCDAQDGCPGDPNKIAPGICGCGASDADSDSDGTVDCNDGCPNDPLKTAPGTCGCGVSDADTDSDGTADCIDGCTSDPNKTAPGTCGCGNPEPGATCNDGNANTTNDVIGTNCLCSGTPIGGGCQPTQLTTTPNPVVTCGIINVKLDGTTTLWADEVPGANRYQYLFTNIPGQPVYSRSIAGPTRSRQLFQWYTTPLKAGRTYRVQVRASFDGGNTWCPYGQICTIRISNQPNPLFREPEPDEVLSEAMAATATMLLLPNPVRDGRVTLTLSDLDVLESTTVTIEVFDATGRRVHTEQVASNGGTLSHVLSLDVSSGPGLYLVHALAGDQRFTERLIVH